MVLFVQGEQAGVGNLRVFSDADLLLSFKQKKRLESGRRVHLLCLSASTADDQPEPSSSGIIGGCTLSSVMLPTGTTSSKTR